MGRMMDTHRNLPENRSTTRAKLLVVIALAIVYGVAISQDAIEILPLTAFPLLAWYVWSIYPVNVFGAVLGVVTLELVTGIASLCYRSEGSIFDLIPFTMLSIAAFVCMAVSIATFLIHACVSRMERREHLLAAAVTCTVCVLWFAVAPRSGGMLNEWALHREIARSDLPEFIDDLNSVTQQLGRAPKDEKEVVELLGRPMPCISRGQICYSSSGGTHFSLGFGFDFGCYEFDSTASELGWHSSLKHDRGGEQTERRVSDGHVSR